MRTYKIVLNATNSFRTSVRVCPVGQVISCFDHHKLAVGVDHSDEQPVDATTQLEQKRNDKPFVLDVVVEERDAVKVWWKCVIIV